MLKFVSTIIVLGSFFGFLTYLFKQLGTWRQIALRFPHTVLGYSGERKTFQSIKIGLVNYRHMVHFESLPQGLHMSVLSVFKLGHPDALIPWHELEIHDNKGLFQNMYQFSFVSLPGKSFNNFRSWGSGFWGRRGSMWCERNSRLNGLKRIITDYD